MAVTEHLIQTTKQSLFSIIFTCWSGVNGKKSHNMDKQNTSRFLGYIMLRPTLYTRPLKSREYVVYHKTSPEQLLDKYLNQTAGCQQHIFHPPCLLKMPSKRMRAFSFQKLLFLREILQIFQTSKVSDFHQKLKSPVQKTNSRNKDSWYATISKIATSTESEKNQVSFKKTQLFLKTNKRLRKYQNCILRIEKNSLRKITLRKI